MLPARVAPVNPFTVLRPCHRNVASYHIRCRRNFSITGASLRAELSRLDASQLIANTPTAKQLLETRIWQSRSSSQSSRKARSPLKDSQPTVAGDKTRVNIVSDELCDDVISYIGKSLKKHKGCDLLDIYPGAGLWSKKLSDVLQPRTHILMEPDADFYKPFLQPLLDKEGTRLIPKAGILWGELNSALSPQYLPHQKRPDGGIRVNTTTNDTLLVTMNLAFFPRKRFNSFDSVTTLLLHQFMDAIRTGSLFHKYGQVRMLIWTRREDKGALLPRMLQKRKRTAVDGELLCEKIHEVVGLDGRDSPLYTRDTTIDRASAVATLRRMKKAKIKIAEGRTSEALNQAMVDIKKRKDAPVPGATPAVFERAYQETLNELNDADESNSRASAKAAKMKKYLAWRSNSDIKRAGVYHELIQRFDTLSALKAEGSLSEEELRIQERELSEATSRLPVFSNSELTTTADNLHLWRQGGADPVLHWDRREYEPLIAQKEEFFPNVDCCLLDITPKPTHRLIGDIGPGASRSGECFELIQKALWASPKEPIAKALDMVWPGAGDWIVPRCSSFRDPKQGGINVNVKHMELTVRKLNAAQWEELIEQWYEWPFRPEFQELLRRSTEEDEDERGATDQHESSATEAD